MRRTGKTETMCIEALWLANTNPEYRVVFACPYENMIRLIFTRLMELVNGSPLLKARCEGSTKNPYEIRFPNNSKILGFTAAASSGNGAASLRGQRANMLFLDEVCFMDDESIENIMMLAAERPDIGVRLSSTPQQAQGFFYDACTNKALGFSEHFHPSTHSPLFGPEMDAEFREELTEIGYLREVMAEFGDQESTVFNKDDIEFCCHIDNYAYNELTRAQLIRLENTGEAPPAMYLPVNNRFKANTFRAIGVDFDKYGASSSIVILDFEPDKNKFRVTRTISIPKVEYSYDYAVNLIVTLNSIYNPAWIYLDRGYGEYQIERLHIYGDEHPESGLKVKVKGFQFAQKIDIPDPVNKTYTSEVVKQVMVSQLALAIERHNIIFSDYDKTLKQELIGYHVERIGSNGMPVFADGNDHFIAALGLAYLAFVLEFPAITKGIKKIEFSSRIKKVNAVMPEQKAQYDLIGMANVARARTPWGNKNIDYNDLPGDRQTYYKVPINKLKDTISSERGGPIGWGSRGGGWTNPSTRRTF